MSSPFDQALAEVDIETSEGPKPKPIALHKTGKDIRSDSVPAIRGSFAKTQAAHLGEEPDSPFDSALRQAYKEEHGTYPAKALPLLSQDDAREVAERQASSPFDEAIQAVREEDAMMALGINRPSKGSPVLKGVLTALSIDEHYLVKGLAKVTGVADKPELSDYTYTNLLKDWGMPDTGWTDAAGLTLSIFASPSTYLTLGYGGATKVGTAGAKALLTKRGLRLATEAAKAATTERVAAVASKTGKTVEEVSRQTVNKIAEEERERVFNQIAQRFSQIDDAKKAAIGKDVMALPESIIEKGGVKFTVPNITRKIIPGTEGIAGRNALAFQEGKVKVFDKALAEFSAGDVKFFGQTVLPGAKIARTIQESGMGEFVTKLSQRAEQTRVGKWAGETAAEFKKGFSEDVAEPATRLKDTFGKAFFVNYKGSEDVLDFMADFQARVRTDALRSKEFSTKFFKGLSLDEQVEFSEAMIKASTESEQTGKIFVKAPSGNAKVQERIDRWLGQGKWAGSSPVQDRIKKLIQGFPEDKALPIWWPGIGQKFETPKLGFREKAFLKARVGDPTLYTRDPVKALSYRMTEIMTDKLQTQFYDEVIKSNKYGIKVLKAGEKLPEGYAQIHKPMSNSLSGGLEARLTKDRIVAPQKFVDGYNQVTQITQSDNPVHTLLSLSMSKFKQNVTVMFPAFHAGNFNGNIVLNAMNIGGHAINPATFRIASRGVMAKFLTRERVAMNWAHPVRSAQEALTRTVETAFGAVLGKNMDEVITTQIGEKLTIKELIKEAEIHGAIQSGMYAADIGGETLSKADRTLYSMFANTMNPLSSDFFLSKAGRQVGEKIETQARLVNYLTWRQKGLSPRMAAMEVNEALFDYNSITNFEKTLNQAWIPFYTFQRKNLEAHIKLFARRPGAVAAQMKFFRELGPTEEEWSEFPDWVKNQMSIKLGDSLVTGFRLPLENIIELGTSDAPELIGRLNPAIRYGVEYGFGKDLRSGREIVSMNAANEFKKAIEVVENPAAPKWLKNIFSPTIDFLKLERDPSHPDKIIGDPDRLHLLRSMPTARWQSTLAMVSNEDRPGYEAAIRYVLGFQRLEPDPELQLSISKRKGIEKLKKIAEKTNFARRGAFPYLFGGAPGQADYANMLLKEIENGASPQQIQEIVDEFEETSKVAREERIKR